MKKLLSISFKGTGGHFTAGAAGVAIGAFIIVFFLGLVSGMHQAVETKIFPEEIIEVARSRSEVLDTLSLLSGSKDSSRLISDRNIERMKRIAGVDDVFPRVRFRFPAKIWGGREIFGMESGTDVVGDGVPAALLAGEKFAVRFKDYSSADSRKKCKEQKDCPAPECCAVEEGKGMGVCTHPVPFILSGKLLEIYNTVIAPAHNLKRLPEWTLKKFGGLRLNMMTGRSYQGAAIKGKPEKICMTFAGVSSRAVDIGITVPIEYAERWNEKYADSYEKGTYSSAVLKITQKRRLGGIIQEVKNDGFSMVSRGQEEIGFFTGILNGIFIVISILVVVVSFIGVSQIFYSILRTKRKEIRLMRALGASRRVIVNLFLSQGFIIGLLGGLAGVAAAFGGSLIADWAAGRYLPDFPFKPDTFFQFDSWIIGLACGLSVLSCLAGAWLPVRKAMRGRLMEVLG